MFSTLEKLSALVSLDGLFQNSILLLRLEIAGLGRTAGKRAVQSIKMVSFDLGHDIEEAEAEAASTKGPEKASEWCCDEGT